MNFVKSFVPFTNENRVLRDNIVENAKSLLRFNPFKSKTNKNEENEKKKPTLKRNFSLPSSRCRANARRNMPLNNIQDEEKKTSRTTQTTHSISRTKSTRESMATPRKFVRNQNDIELKPREELEDDINGKEFRKTPLRRQNSIRRCSIKRNSIENPTYNKLTKSAEAKKISSPQTDRPALIQQVQSFPNSLRSYNKLPNKLMSVSSTNLRKSHIQDSTASLRSNSTVVLSSCINEKTKSTNDIDTVLNDNESTLTRSLPISSLNSTEEEIPIRLELSSNSNDETLSEEVMNKILNWEIDSSSEGFIDDDSLEINNIDTETLSIIVEAEGEMDKLKGELDGLCRSLSVITRKMEKFEIRESPLI